MISKFSLQGATMLNKSEMKSISGGRGNCCAYSTDWSQPGFTCLIIGSTSDEANFMATDDGWWACNTPEVIEGCEC